KLPRIKLNPRFSQQLLQKKAANEMTEGEAVGFGHLIYVIGRDESGGPRHVLHNNCGGTWDMFPFMTGNKPRIGIIYTAPRGADDDANRLALVERLLCRERRSG